MELLDIQLRRPTLDEVFLTLTADDQSAGAPTTPPTAMSATSTQEASK